MKKKILCIVSMLTFSLIFALNINLSVDNNTDFNITLSTVEVLAAGECTATALNCSVSCVGTTMCFPYEDFVDCDGVYKYCP